MLKCERATAGADVVWCGVEQLTYLGGHTLHDLYDVDVREVDDVRRPEDASAVSLVGRKEVRHAVALAAVDIAGEGGAGADGLVRGSQAAHAHHSKGALSHRCTHRCRAAAAAAALRRLRGAWRREGRWCGGLVGGRWWADLGVNCVITQLSENSVRCMRCAHDRCIVRATPVV